MFVFLRFPAADFFVRIFGLIIDKSAFIWYNFNAVRVPCAVIFNVSPSKRRFGSCLPAAEQTLYFQSRIKIFIHRGEVLKWWRGAPAKGVGRVTGARVQISPSPPAWRWTRFVLGSALFFMFDSRPIGSASFPPRYKASRAFCSACFPAVAFYLPPIILIRHSCFKERKHAGSEETSQIPAASDLRLQIPRIFKTQALLDKM